VVATLAGGAGFRHDSAALCDDGRVLYVWVDGGNGVYQCHYPGIGDFEAANNDAATSATEFHAVLDSTITLVRTTVWRHPTTGEVYLFANYRTSQPAAWGQVWRSPSGNGESAPGTPDWTLQGTMAGPVTTSFVDIGFAANVGEPLVTGTGRWVLPSFYPTTWDNNQQGIYTSDDEGAGWTRRLNIGYYAGGHYGYGQGRNVVDHAGALWMGTNGNVEGPHAAYSSDNGSSWTVYDVPGGVNSGGANPVVASGSDAWRLGPPSQAVGGTPLLQIGTDYAGAEAGWTTVADMYAMDGATFNGAILQRLAPGHDVFLWDGHILAGRGGWSVGQVRIA